VRRPPEPRFSAVTMTFELAGVTQDQADSLVQTYRSRWPLYGTVAGATAVKVKVIAQRTW